MNRKVTVVGGRRQRWRHRRARDRAKRAGRRRDRRHRRHARRPASRSTSTSRVRSKDRRARVVGVGTKDFAESAQFRRRRHHVGRAAQAGHEPRRPADRQLQDHAGRDGRDRQALAELHHRAGRQPARRDVAGRVSPEQVPARARDRHGRRARFGAHAHVHRHGAERVGRKRVVVRARRPRRHDGAAAALLDGGRHSDYRTVVGRTTSRRSASAPPTAAPKSPSWSAPARGTRRAPRPR